jgi:hypothetical protein
MRQLWNNTYLPKKKWKGLKGETALVRKDEWLVIMISAMISREFGWGIYITKEQLETINAIHLRQAYRDGESAKAKRGDSN